MQNPFRSAFRADSADNAGSRSVTSEPEMDLTNRTFYGVVPRRYQDEFDLAVYSAISELQVQFLARCVIPNEGAMVNELTIDNTETEILTENEVTEGDRSESASGSDLPHQDSDTNAIHQFLSDANLEEISMRDDYIKLSGAVNNVLGRLSYHMTQPEVRRMIYYEIVVPWNSHDIPTYPPETEDQKADDLLINDNMAKYRIDFERSRGMDSVVPRDNARTRRKKKRQNYHLAKKFIQRSATNSEKLDSQATKDRWRRLRQACDESLY